METIRNQFKKFQCYIFMREFIFCLFIVEIIAVLYLIVHDQALMPDIQGSAFALYRRPDTTRVAAFRVDEVCAMGAHAIATIGRSDQLYNPHVRAIGFGWMLIWCSGCDRPQVSRQQLSNSQRLRCTMVLAARI